MPANVWKVRSKFGSGTKRTGVADMIAFTWARLGHYVVHTA